MSGTLELQIAFFFAMSAMRAVRSPFNTRTRLIAPFVEPCLILACTSVHNANDAQDWQLMSAIKANILRRMDTALPGVRACCVKFLQQVVLVQTPGVVDPRVSSIALTRKTMASYTPKRPDHSDISLALVPRDHPVIPYASLEAEGHGLLDRLLDIIHGDHRSDRQSQGPSIALTWNSDGLLVTATLNTLGVLMHRRPIAANKILTSIFNFNPLKLASSPLTPKNKVIMKSIERTTKSLLMNIMKRYVFVDENMNRSGRLLSSEILRTQTTAGYSSTWNACIACALKWLTR